jgi:hypothetical protein
MQGGPGVDREITERFGGVLERARRGELDHWAQTPRGRLALIIVLDRFSGNFYRGSPLSYSHDGKALELAFEGIDLGIDAELGAVVRLVAAGPLRGGSGRSAAPPQGNVRVRCLSGQGCTQRHSPLRPSPAPQRSVGAYLNTRRARVLENGDAAAPATASLLGLYPTR